MLEWLYRSAILEKALVGAYICFELAKSILSSVQPYEKKDNKLPLYEETVYILLCPNCAGEIIDLSKPCLCS